MAIIAQLDFENEDDVKAKADAGDPDALANLALIKELGLEGIPDKRGAQKLYRAAAKKGHKNSCAYLALAEQKRAEKEALHLQRAASNEGGADKARSLFEGKSILVVEDSASEQRILNGFLRKLGYQTIQAGDGEEALRVYEAGKKDICLVMTDVLMPKMTGFQLIERLQSLHKDDAPSTPVIIVSSNTSKDSIVKARSLGVKEWLLKPFDLVKIQKAIIRAVQ